MCSRRIDLQSSQKATTTSETMTGQGLEGPYYGGLNQRYHIYLLLQLTDQRPKTFKSVGNLSIASHMTH